MNRLAHDIINSAGEQIQRLFERAVVAERDRRRPAATANHLCRGGAFAGVAQQEAFNRHQFGLRGAGEPDLEIEMTQMDKRESFTLELRLECRPDFDSVFDKNDHPRPLILYSPTTRVLLMIEWLINS